MTLATFNRYYKHYKDNFDFELCLKLGKTTYEKAERIASQADEWF